jgi:hypothetical protein
MHYDLPDDDFGPERPAYETVPGIVEGELVEIEGFRAQEGVCLLLVAVGGSRVVVGR